MKGFVVRSLPLLLAATLFNTPSLATPLYCQLDKGYILPDGVEFGSECFFTDMDEQDILWLVSKSDGHPFDKKYGFVNRFGELVIPLIYDNAEAFSEGKANVNFNGDWGYINTQGQWVIANIYEHAQRFMDDIAVVKKGNKYGMINTANQVVVPFEYEAMQRYYPNKPTIAKKGGKWGVIDNQNQVIVPFKYEYIYQLESDEPEAQDWKFSVKTEGKETILNAKGEQVFPTYEEIGFFSDGLANVKKGGKWGFVDANNDTQIDFIYDDAGGFLQHLAKVTRKGKSGFITPENEVFIPLIYDDIKSGFHENKEVTSARIGDTFYLLNKTGEVIKTNFTDIDYFNNGLAIAKLKDGHSPSGEYYGLIDDKGKTVLSFSYPYLTYNVVGEYRGLYSMVTEDNKMYIINPQGDIIADKTDEFEMMMYF